MAIHNDVAATGRSPAQRKSWRLHCHESMHHRRGGIYAVRATKCIDNLRRGDRPVARTMKSTKSMPFDGGRDISRPYGETMNHRRGGIYAVRATKRIDVGRYSSAQDVYRPGCVGSWKAYAKAAEATLVFLSKGKKKKAKSLKPRR